MVAACATKTSDGICFLIIFVSLLSDYACLRLTNMTAPVIQDPRNDMHLFCEFDMGGEELYAVKWYKDDHEFFRYSPAGNQRLLQFQVIGVHVDLARTRCSMTSCSLTLNELSKTFSSGAYRCEVSTEAPAFRLASQTHNITVAVIPEGNPTIEGLRDKYLVGDHLVATCSSGFGDPKPSISWYLNKQLVNNKSVKDISQRTASSYHDEDKVKLKRTTVQLRLPLDKKLTANKSSTTIELSCLQSMDNLGTALLYPTNTTRTVQVTTDEQQVKNQMLYGVFGCATSISATSLFLVLIALHYFV